MNPWERLVYSWRWWRWLLTGPLRIRYDSREAWKAAQHEWWLREPYRTRGGEP